MSQNNQITPPPTQDNLKYIIQPTSVASLPTGVAFDPQMSVSRNVDKRSSVNASTLRYYINDGPQGPHEGLARYKLRMRRAILNMEIERRFTPGPADKDLIGLSASEKVIERRKQRIEANKESNLHRLKLDPANGCDPAYITQWKAEKRARQARNAVRRREAQEQLRAEFLTWPEVGRRLPTPPPPDDSGDELYDFSANQGPIFVIDDAARRVERKRKLQGKQVRPARSESRNPAESPEESGRLLKCESCNLFRANCSMAETGRPCTRCVAVRSNCRE